MPIKHLSKAIGLIILGLLLVALGISQRHSLSNPHRPIMNVATQTTEPHVVAADSQLDMASLKARLEARLPGIEVSDISPSPLAGFYQVFFSGQLMYVTADGEYVITGSLLELAEGAPINHSTAAIAEFENRQAPMRKQTIDAIPESDMVVFKAPEEKYVITVFTDVDCAYCRKLHKEMPALNAQGVTVRYMAYPRAGIGSDAYKKLVSVWCSDDRQAAMNEAKNHRVFSDKTCKNPIAQQYEITQQFNLNGTPAIILQDGELIGGYVPHADLIAHLEEKAARNKMLVSKVSASQM